MKKNLFLTSFILVLSCAGFPNTEPIDEFREMVIYDARKISNPDIKIVDVVDSIGSLVYQNPDARDTIGHTSVLYSEKEIITHQWKSEFRSRLRQKSQVIAGGVNGINIIFIGGYESTEALCQGAICGEKIETVIFKIAAHHIKSVAINEYRREIKVVSSRDWWIARPNPDDLQVIKY